MPDNYISVGKIRKPHGLSGAFSFTLVRELKSLKKPPPHFFIQSKGAYIPYFVSHIEMTDIFNGYLQLEDITSPEKAKQLSSSELYLDEKVLNQLFKKDAEDYSDYIGYIAYDKEIELGPIGDILNMPAQVLAVIIKDDQEIMIPMVDDLILEIDKRKKHIRFNVPDGLY